MIVVLVFIGSLAYFKKEAKKLCGEYLMPEDTAIKVDDVSKAALAAARRNKVR